MKTTVIIQGSSNPKGNTYKTVQLLNKNNNFDIIDLATKNIGHFDYEYNNSTDDFLPLMKQIISNYDTIVFATPVYWYAMSGILKVFFDRISDLLTDEKSLGRKLRGKKMAMFSNSAKDDLLDGFTMPFTATAKYLGMDYIGDIHIWFSDDGKEIHPNAIKKTAIFREHII